MVDVEFTFNNAKSIIQCNLEDKMKDIFLKYSSKMQSDVNSFCFLYGGDKINEEITLKELIKSNNEMKILVVQIDEPLPVPNQSLVRSKNITCPECQEDILFTFLDYKINLLDCRNGHNSKNILIDDFEKTQIHDYSKIICNNCKTKNKMNSFQNEFYKCLTCTIHLCPLCKSLHDQTHNIINPDKNFRCLKHNESYSTYCTDCNINCCTICESIHREHRKVNFGDIMTNIDEIKIKMKDLKNIIDSFNSNINEIIKQLNTIQKNLNIYYKISEDIINNFDRRNRNYEILKNINELNNNTNIMKELEDIINDKNLLSKLDRIFNIYKMMVPKKEIIFEGEITLKYKINKNDDSIKIFG